MKTHFQIMLEELGQYAVPILTKRKHTKSPYLVGTGTFFRSATDIFLITAKHVVDELEDGLVITSGKNGFIRFPAKMAAFKYSKGSGMDHDICIVQMPNPAIEELHSHFKFVDNSLLSLIDAYDKLTLYAFIGYPHSKNKPKPNSLVKEIKMKPYYYTLREFLDVSRLTTCDKSEKLHVAFSAPLKKTKDVNLQNNIQPPKPHGISGCGVWKIKLSKTTGKVDQCALVAVGIEYLKNNNAFLATRIHSPLMAIKQFEKCLTSQCT